MDDTLDRLKYKAQVIKPTYKLSIDDGKIDDVEKTNYASLYGTRSSQLIGLKAGQIPQSAVTNYIEPKRNILAADSISTRVLSVGSKDWNSNAVWTNGTTNRIDWNAHTIVFADGSSVSISSGNYTTTDTTNRFYIYYKKGDATYSITISQNTAIGTNKFVVASFKNDASGRMTIFPVDTYGTLISGNSITTGIVQSSDGRTYFDLNNSLIKMADATTDRLKIDGSNGVFKISKPSIDVDTAKTSELIYSTTTYPFAFVFSSTSGSSAPDPIGAVGAVYYPDDIDTNMTVSVKFYKYSDWKITGARVRLLFENGFYNDGSGPVETQARYVYLRLNPIKNIVSGSGSTGVNYYIYENGTALLSNQTLSSDFEELTYTFSTDTNGIVTSFTDNDWNYLIVQQETRGNEYQGFCVIQLELRGYIDLS